MIGPVAFGVPECKAKAFGLLMGVKLTVPIDWIDLTREVAYPPKVGEGLSATRRRTLQNEAMIASGFHPVTRRPLRPEGGRCGECSHLVASGHNRTYYKCDTIPMTHGPGTDIRLSWPACKSFEPAGGLDEGADHG